jgi:pyridoxal phosphate enzyme (YggS family)
MSIQGNIEAVHARMAAAARAAGRRPEEIRLVAVSKTVEVERVREAVAAGVSLLGENYVQEAREKIHALGTTSVAWHFIGHLQTNKARQVVPLFDLIHSVDSLKLAQELDKQAARFGKRQAVLVQVNTGRETSKSGIYAENALPLIRAVSQLEHLEVRGLMTLPPFFDAPGRARPYFRQLRELRDQYLQEFGPASGALELSMGMTGDFEAAIAEGATMVRIGTAIFGARP